MLFLLGFLLLMLGFAMIVLGRVPVTKTWTIPARVSRSAGGIFVGFLPVVFLVRFLVQALGWEEHVNPVVIHWMLFVLCLLAGGGWILVAGRPATSPRPRPAGDQPAPFAGDPISPASSAAAREPTFSPLSSPSSERPRPQERNPFDFS